MWNVEAGSPVCFSTKDSTFVWMAKHYVAVQFISWGSAGIVTAAGDGACLWNANLPDRQTGYTGCDCPLQIFQGHTGLITSACQSADERWVLTASQDCSARIWNVRNGHCTDRLVGHESPLNCAAFSSDSSKVLTAGGVLCMMFEAATGICLQVFSGHCGVVSWVGFSADDAVAVTASHDGSIRLWDVSEGESLQSFTTDSWDAGAPTRRAQGAISACFCA
jgi:WD40 repeat protein